VAGETTVTSHKTTTAGVIAALAIGLSLVSGGILLRRQQDQTRLAAIVATQNAGSVAEAPLVDAGVTLVPFEEESAPPPPENTASAAANSGAANPLANVTAAPTATPVPAHTISLAGTDFPPPAEPPSTPIPPAVEPIPVPDGVVNILLLGSDKRLDPDDPGYRTDTIIVVSIDRNEGSVSMLSFPRDLYVYIPGWTMNRINTADSRGSAVGWEGGGPGLVRSTLLYNFGIQTHYYARVDFDGFTAIVDTLGGIDLPVDCPTTGYTLIDHSVSAADFSSYDEWAAYTDPESDNWVETTLDVGVHHLDGYMALWYARQRTGSSDYQRAYRQQQVLRAIWHEATGLGWLEPGPESVARLSSLWVTANEVIETDMGLGNVLQMAPIAADLDTSRIRSYFIGPGETVGWITPDEQQVVLPQPEAAQHIVELALQPPAANYAAANTATVEVRNGTTLDRLDEVAADRLGWNALIAIPTGPADNSNYEDTVIFDFTGTTKGSQLNILQKVLSVPIDRVTAQPDPNRTVDYLVILGQDYTERTCGF
jgi:LCP family protein required for cell wall assembly